MMVVTAGTRNSAGTVDAGKPKARLVTSGIRRWPSGWSVESPWPTPVEGDGMEARTLLPRGTHLGPTTRSRTQANVLSAVGRPLDPSKRRILFSPTEVSLTLASVARMLASTRAMARSKSAGGMRMISVPALRSAPFLKSG